MEKCYVLFPGKFKPVHSGHIALMEKYLNSTEYDVDLTIVISKAPKEGLTPETSKWFLDTIFAKNRNVHVIVSPDPSPIGTVYNLTGEKAMGDGIYAMGTSAKGDDIKRAEAFVKKFAEGEKYYTPGVKTIFFPVNPEPLPYVGRNDAFADAAISSTIVRQDLRNDDFEMFKTSYIPMLEEGLVNEALLKEYFEKLKAELLPLAESKLCDSINESYFFNTLNETLEVLNEGGAAGHMEHPYDVNEFTFADLKNLIIDLFAGKIQDITEKLDGQNLFASVDEHGNTIFARNEGHLHTVPWLLQDIMNNPKWIGNPSVQHAFSNAALTIDKVFKNIPNAIKFFNYDDRADGVRYRKWLNLEIIDTQNFNVIPYVESKVSFHGFKCTAFDYSELDAISQKERDPRSIIDDPDEIKDKEILQKAIDKTNRTAFKAQITPTVVFKTVEKGEMKANKYIEYIDKLLAKYDLPDDATIAEFKVEGICQYFEKSGRLKFVSGDLLSALIKRWIFGMKEENIQKIAKTYENEDGEIIATDKAKYALLRDFEKNDLPLVLKKIISPLDALFIKVGNEALKCIQGLANAGHEAEVVKALRKDMNDIKAAVNSDGDEKSRAKLEQAIKRLAVVNDELNSTEGIVFNYNGHTLKLTGSFAPLNQLMGLSFGKFGK
jgi:hypothetical protein